MRTVLLSAMLCVMSMFARAQQVPNTIDEIDQAISNVADSVCANVRSDNLKFFVSEHPDRDWAASIIGRRMQKAGRVAHLVRIEDESDVVFSIEDISTRYTLREDSDSILRTIVVKISARNRSASPSGLMLPVPSLRSDHVISRDVAEATQSQQHSGSHGTVPPPPSSFWDDLAQPVIFIAAAATTVLLLFTVRSQ
ncbi:MAG: hypothetical protein IPM83_00420 [Ignavibacteria bacterium]|nr:hypothetical protein [Ignavibacteria bacterium]